MMMTEQQMYIAMLSSLLLFVAWFIGVVAGRNLPRE